MLKNFVTGLLMAGILGSAAEAQNLVLVKEQVETMVRVATNVRQVGQNLDTAVRAAQGAQKAGELANLLRQAAAGKNVISQIMTLLNSTASIPAADLSKYTKSLQAIVKACKSTNVESGDLKLAAGRYKEQYEANMVAVGLYGSARETNGSGNSFGGAFGPTNGQQSGGAPAMNQLQTEALNVVNKYEGKKKITKAEADELRQGIRTNYAGLFGPGAASACANMTETAVANLLQLLAAYGISGDFEALLRRYERLMTVETPQAKSSVCYLAKPQAQGGACEVLPASVDRQCVAAR
jgi:hypothetical protein